MSEDDDATAAETSLRRAVEQLCGDGAGDGSEAAQEAVQALADGSGKAWTPEQETQIRAMVEQIRKLRDLNRPGGGWWRRRREWRTRERLVDMMMAGGPELLNEGASWSRESRDSHPVDPCEAPGPSAGSTDCDRHHGRLGDPRGRRQLAGTDG
ncbi:hypothetical protein ACGFR6_36280 [Streptomyces sp. NPDC048567]|uniref:hypothetical protein n=1 Tax=Streptomyces sp. NPDC048567 TaxID=3365570 RepID=UPI0037237A78